MGEVVGEITEEWIVQNAFRKMGDFRGINRIAKDSSTYKILHELIEEIALEAYIYGKEAHREEVDRLQAQIRRLG